jgi:hypothetical protein
MKRRNKLKAFLFNITPRVYILHDVIFIRWMDKEFYILKDY